MAVTAGTVKAGNMGDNDQGRGSIASPPSGLNRSAPHRSTVGKPSMTPNNSQTPAGRTRVATDPRLSKG